MKEKEVHVLAGRLYVPYFNSYGTLASNFFTDLRDNQHLAGTKCPSCKKVFMPPRSICPDCFSKMEELVELPPTGTLLTYTVVNYTYSTYYQPKQAPYIVGIIKLDGADTGLCHLLDEVKPKDVKIGMRVQAVLKDERKGDILDIAYFKPI